MANVKISELPAQQKIGNTGAAPASNRNIDLAYTWNSGGTTFTADYLNITNTASAAGSLIFDRQVGGSSVVSLRKDGFMMWGTSTGATISQFGGELYLGTTSSYTVRILTGASTGINLAATSQLSWASVAGASNAPDTGISRHGAGVTQFNNGTVGNVRGLQGGGAAVASAAALPLPTGNVFHVTGTTGITSITSTNFQSGVQITLIFDAALTVTDGGNLRLAGNFVTTADDTLTLVFDGTNWYEIARSVN